MATINRSVRIPTGGTYRLTQTPTAGPGWRRIKIDGGFVEIHLDGGVGTIEVLDSTGTVVTTIGSIQPCTTVDADETILHVNGETS